MFFFKDIENWENSKIKKVKWACNLLYLIAVLIIPIIITTINYSLFEKAPATVKLTGVGIIVLLIVLLWGYKKINEVIDSLAESTYKERCLRFGLKWIFSAIPYIALLIAMALVKDELLRAYNTLFGCIISWAVATTIKHLFIDFITSEIKLRNDAVKDNEKLKRRRFI